jgi:hypothetical protein
VVEATRNPLTTLRLTPSEVVLSAALLTALSLAIYLPHIVDGGWYIDDWIFVAQMSEAGGVIDAFQVISAGSHRPGLALSLSLFHAIGQQEPQAYLTIGALLAALQGWLFFLVMRMLGLRPALAAIAAAIFLVLPVVDSTRLWLAAFPIQVAGILYLLGVLIALRGVAATGRRAVAWHAGAAVLFLAAILTYELVAGLIVVTALLYLVRAGWRPALRRWPADLASVALALAIIAPRAADDREAHTSLSFIWDRAGGTLGEGEMVFRWLLPWHDVLGGQVGVVLLLVGMLGAGIAIGRRGETGAGLAAWTKIAGLATVFSLAGLVMLLPADPYFVPRISGMGNRTGAFAALGAVLLLIALIVIALGGLGVLLRRPRIGFALAAVFVVATGLNLGARELRQQEPWADSWRQQKETLVAIDQALGGELPADAAVVSFGHTTFILPADVSVFAYNWDLRGALWEVYDQPDVEARPWELGAVCDPTGMTFADEADSPPSERGFGYRRLIFVDASTRRGTRIRSQAACETVVAAITGRAPA